MTRHIVWQAGLALLGIGLVFIILFQLASNQTHVVTAEIPASGGTYIEGVLGYSERINPILSPAVVKGNPIEQDLSALVFDGLTSLDATGQVSPALAIDWDLSEDGSVYQFYLRPDVTWHDGAPFTAADVAFTVQAMQDPNFQGDPSLRELWRTTIADQLDQYTIRFTLQEPFPSFLLYTTIGLLPAHLLSDVPASELSEHSFSTEHPVGTGRFMVESISPDRVVLAANPNYWGPTPYLERSEFWFYGEWDDLLTDYERGKIHGFHPAKPEELQATGSIPNLQIYSAPAAGYDIVYLNHQQETLPFFQEQEVRQALLYALDRQLLIDQALGGQGLVAHSPMLPTSWAYDSSIRQYQHDPERAIGLLDAAGWLDSDADRIRDRDGVRLSFDLLTQDDPTMIRLAEEIGRQWREVGVEARVQAVGHEALTTYVVDRNFEAAIVEIGLSADPDPYPLWHSTQGESGQNFSGFASEEADLVMEESRLTTDPERRTELYHAFQQIFAEEVPSLLLYHPIYSYAVDDQVQAVQIGPLLHTSDRFRSIEDWYIQTEVIEISETQELDKLED